jgi:hypothetical protein
MLTKTKLALAAALIAGTASAAFAQEGTWNGVTRYDNGYVSNRGLFQSAPVALDRSGRPIQDNTYLIDRDGSRAYPGDRAGHLVDGGGN